MKRLHGKLTYANVVATLALFLVVAGGSAFAATKLAKNSVGTKQIKTNAITSAKIKDGAVTGAKINLGSLGTVPSAAHADSATRADSATSATNAQNLQGLSAAQITAASKLACPSATIEVVGLCFENAPRPSVSYLTALEGCAKAEMILPSVSEMDTFDIVTKNSSPAEWAGQLYYDGAVLRAEAISKSTTGGEEIFSSHPYRCAVPPAN